MALPKATVNKFANDIAHSLDVRLTADTRDLIATCCSEFVQLLSSEANDICEKDKKKTITPEHVLRALNQLGLHRFNRDVQEEYDRAKVEEAKQKMRQGSKRERNKAAQMDPDELLRKQEELFALARSDPIADNDLGACGAGDAGAGATGDGGSVGEGGHHDNGFPVVVGGQASTGDAAAAAAESGAMHHHHQLDQHQLHQLHQQQQQQFHPPSYR